VAIRTDAPLGAPCWLDLTTSDLERAQDFYSAVLGWTFESTGPAYGGYVNASKGGHQVAGLMANFTGSQTPDRWTTYFYTADVDATIVAVSRAEDTPYGRLAAATDPTGTAFNLSSLTE
jgi:uncharacterized protein